MLTKEQEYYIKQFDKIDRKELSWNWAAFFFGPLWLMYRKSYVGLLNYAVFSMVLLIVDVVQPFVAKNVVYGTAVMLLWPLVCGLCGNRWHYSTVKYRLAHGYHLCKSYQPTSSSLVWFTILGRFVERLLEAYFFGFSVYFELLIYLLAFIYWYKDERSVREAMNGKTIADAELSVENIAKLI